MTHAAPRRPRGRRPHILFAWELGANFGHASKIVEVVRAIGPLARVSIAARDPQALAALAPGLALDMRTAPHAPPPAPPPRGPAPPVLNYSDALRFCGWQEAEGLAGLIRAWQAIYSELAPDLIVAQAAPTALLAARGGAAAVLTLGSGFDAPARVEPMPPYRTGTPQADLIAAEARTLAVAEAALRATGGPPLGRFRALFDAGPMLLAALVQTDHYHPRRRWEPDHPPYLGHLFTVDQGEELGCAGDGRARVLAYLRPGTHGLATAAPALAARARAWDCVLAVPGLPAGAAGSLRAAGLRVVDGPVRLDRLLPGADLLVSHASNGIVAAGLTAGVPQVLLPTQTEQAMLARVLGAQNLGIALPLRSDAQAAAGAIAQELRDAPLRAATETIAASSNADPAGTVAARLLALAAEAM